jgi:RsiW-degrading membrane proteinase PrsW (M82 family)
VTQYEHTQTGHVIVWALLVGIVLCAIGAIFESSPHRETLLIASVVLLITLALFYKLTITINEETLRASFGIGLSARECRLRKSPHPNRFVFAGGTAGKFI